LHAETQRLGAEQQPPERTENWIEVLGRVIATIIKRRHAAAATRIISNASIEESVEVMVD
jgi:hypothetical protein